MKKFAIALTLFAALAATTPAFAIGDRYELWSDTNGDMYVDTILDTDPGTTPEFYLSIVPPYGPTLMKVYDTATSTWTTVGGSNGITYVGCDPFIGALRCEKL